MAAWKDNEVLGLGPDAAGIGGHPRHAPDHSTTRGVVEAEWAVVTGIHGEAMITVGVQRGPERQTDERVVVHRHPGEITSGSGEIRHVVSLADVIHRGEVPRIATFYGGVVGATLDIRREHSGNRHVWRRCLRRTGPMQSHPVELHVDGWVSTGHRTTTEQLEPNDRSGPERIATGEDVQRAVEQVEMLRGPPCGQYERKDTPLAGRCLESYGHAQCQVRVDAHGGLRVLGGVDRM